MSKNIIAQPQRKDRIINDLLSQLKEAYGEDARKLIYLLYDKGVSQQEIGNTLGKTREAISKQYPQREKEVKL